MPCRLIGGSGDLVFELVYRCVRCGSCMWWWQHRHRSLDCLSAEDQSRITEPLARTIKQDMMREYNL